MKYDTGACITLFFFLINVCVENLSNYFVKGYVNWSECEYMKHIFELWMKD